MSVLNKETYTVAQADSSDFPIDSAREKTEKELVSTEAQFEEFEKKGLKPIS